MGNKKRNMDTTSKDKSDIARDIEFHFYGHRFPFTICALFLCLFVLYLLTGVRFTSSYFSQSSTSLPSRIFTFLAFLQANRFVIRSCIVILFLLLLNPKFRDLTPTRIIIASVVAIAGDYLFEKVIQHGSNELTPLFLLILWCIAWGFINYDYQQRYNKEEYIRKYFTEERIKQIREEYKEWQLLSDKIDRMQKSVEDRYYRLVIEQSKLDALPKSNYKKEKEQELSKLRIASYSSGRSYEYYETELQLQQELRSIDEEIWKAKEEIRREITDMSTTEVDFLVLKIFEQDNNYELGFTHFVEALKSLARTYTDKTPHYSEFVDTLIKSLTRTNPKIASFLSSNYFFSYNGDGQFRLLVENMLIKANKKNQEHILLLRKLIDFINHCPTFKIPVQIREITLKASRDTIRFLFIISLQVLIAFVAKQWIPIPLIVYCLIGSLVFYLVVMICHLIDRCLKETTLVSVIEGIGAFAKDTIENTVLSPFYYVFSLGVVLEPIVENILMFTWREYSVANGSRNPILLLSNALADVSLRTILLTIRMVVVSLRFFVVFLFCSLHYVTFWLTFIVAVIPIIFIVSIFYSLAPLSKLIYGVLAEIVLSVESNLRRYYLEWILLIIWALSVNILANLALIRISGTYPWISLVTFTTLIISYLVFMFYGALSTGRTLEEEWNYIKQPLSERLAEFIFSFLVLSWVLIGIDRLFSLNHFKPQSDLVVGTLILISLTVIVFITSTFVQTE